MTSMGMHRLHMPRTHLPHKGAFDSSDTFTERHAVLVAVITLLSLLVLGAVVGSGLGAALVSGWEHLSVGDLFSTGR